MKKKIFIITSVLLITFLFLSMSFASSINVDSNVNGENVVLSVNGTPNTTMSLIVEDDNRLFYIDQKITDKSGDAIFTFTLSKYENKNYDYKIKNGYNSISGDINIKTEELTPITIEEASLKIIGYENTILSKTSGEIKNGDTVLSFTKRILRKKDIDYDDRGGYLSNIDGLKQFDKGSKSGWMFSVNGDFPEIGADNVRLREDDYIKWLYTSDMGKDIGNKYEEVVEEFKYEIFIDEFASEKELSEAIGNSQDILQDKIKEANTENEKESAIKEANKIYKSILSIPTKNITKELSVEIIDNSVKTIKNMVDLIDNEDSFEVQQEISKVFEKNVGLVLKLICVIDNKEIVDKYLDDILKTNNQMLNKSNMNVKLNKLKINTLAIDISNIIENNNAISLPLSLLKKANEVGISNIFIKNDLTIFNITPNTIKSDDSNNKLVFASNIVDKKTLPDNVSKLLSENNILINLEAKLGDKEITNFNDTIQVSIKYDGDVKKSDEVTVFLLEDDGNIVSVGGIYDEKTKMVKFLTNHFSNYYVKNESKSFEDSIDHWASNEINVMASKGIIKGKTNELFMPNENVSRAEFAVLVSRMLKLKSDSNNVKFNDIQKDDWYYEDIALNFENGLINGRSENEFDPSGKISRQEMAKIISNILLKNNYIKSDNGILDKFIDKDEISNWAKDDIALVIREQIFKGVDSNKFGPLESVNRAQAATILYRVYKL